MKVSSKSEASLIWDEGAGKAGFILIRKAKRLVATFDSERRIEAKYGSTTVALCTLFTIRYI